jgi:hypothetical protein
MLTPLFIDKKFTDDHFIVFSLCPVTIHRHRCCPAEFRPVITGSTTTPMPSTTNDQVELVNNARKGGSEPVQSSTSGSHCSKKSRTSTALQERPVVASSRTPSHKLDKHSHEEPIKLPTGVINVFPTNNDQSRCCCPTQPQRTTLTSCDIAQVFLSQYGGENLIYLQEKERREYPSKSLTSQQTFKTPSAPLMLLLSAQTSQEDEIAIKLAGYLSPPSGGVSEAKFLPPSGVVAKAEFLENSSNYLPKQPWVTTRMRAKTVSWLVEVTVDLNISEKAFHVAISILDRVFRSGAAAEQYRANPEYDWDADFFCIRICELQALGWYVFACPSCQDCIFRSLPFSSTCVWMGSKLEDKSKLRQEDMALITNNSVTTATIRKLEFRVFRQLGFSLQCSTPLHYLNAYLRASRACPCRRCEYDHPVLRQMVMYLLCLARLPSGLMDQRPSLVVAAALYLARATLGIQDSQTPAYPHKYWSRTLQYYTGYSVSDLYRSVLLIYSYQSQAHELGMAPFDKYKVESCLKVSLIPARPWEDLDLSNINHCHDF